MLLTVYACWFHSVRVPTQVFAASPNTVMPRYAGPPAGGTQAGLPVVASAVFHGATLQSQPPALGSAPFEIITISA